MKKKGLIISTVVMVVVLIASLTTATYAWFSSSAAATVSNISVNVGAASSVQIGVSNGGNKTAQAGYVFGDVTWADNKFSGAAGLGASVNTGFALDVKAGVGTGTTTEGADPENVMDEALNLEHGFYTGEGVDFESLKNVAPAIVNGTTTDVVDLDMGIRVVGDGNYGTYCLITVTPTEGQAFMGMATALHFVITVGENEVYNGTIFPETTTWSSANVETKFYFMIDALQSTQMDKGTEGNGAPITAFNIKFFISGYDADCCNDATDTGATISLSFDSCKAADWTADAGWIELKKAAVEP